MIPKECKRPSASNWRCRLVKRASLGTGVAVEVTPFVLNGRLYRVENWPKHKEFPYGPVQYRFHEDEIRIRDVEADEIVSVVFRNHYFGEGFVWEGRFYLFAGDYAAEERWWHIRQIVMTSSDDLVNWTEPVGVMESESGERLFNTAVCRGEDRFALLHEVKGGPWPDFTFKYSTSDDLVHWTPVPGGVYGPDRYVGGPALYCEGGRYYTLYLHNMGDRYETRITRSVDLVHWEEAPEGRPFLTFDPERVTDPEHHPDVREINASDAELCEWKGKTIVYFCGGNQGGVNDLQWAEFDGTPRELLEHYFE